MKRKGTEQKKARKEGEKAPKRIPQACQVWFHEGKQNCHIKITFKMKVIVTSNGPLNVKQCHDLISMLLLSKKGTNKDHKPLSEKRPKNCKITQLNVETSI
jgi:hypothetical protein